MGVIIKKLAFRGSKGEATLEALFDSGASMSFIRESLAEKLGKPDTMPQPMKFQTAERDRHVVAERVVRLEFKLNGEWLSDEFLILPDDVFSENVIIGAKTMQAWRIIIDMEKEEVRSVRTVKKHMLKEMR